jgi:hypothetical protein
MPAMINKGLPEVARFRFRGIVLIVGAWAACGGSSGLGANDNRDAASVGTGGAVSAGGSGLAGGIPGSGGMGSGGITATGGGTGAGGATGSGGRPGSGGASGGVVASGGTSGKETGLGGTSTGMPVSGGKTGGGAGATGGLSSGGNVGVGGVSAAGGTSLVSTARDAGSSYDVPSEGPRSDSSAPDRAAQDAGADAGRADGLSAAQQEYVNTFAEPYCSRLAECCAQQGLPTSGLGPCEANELLFVKHLDDGSEVMDTTTIQTILSQLQNSCDQPSYALLAGTTKGTRLAGEPCEAVDQCAGDPALCLSSSGSSSGKCMTPPRGKAGDGCSSSCDDVTVCKWGTSEGKSPYSACYEQDGLRCDTTTTFTCVPITAPGAKCTDYAECGVHAECNNQTCVAKVKLGASCSNGKICDSGLQCVSSGGSVYACQKYSVAWSGSCSP